MGTEGNGPGSISLRDRHSAFIDRHEIAWELTFAGLAILYVVVGFGDTAANQAEAEAVLLADIALTVAFAAEFVTRFLAARDRRAYLRGHWIDLVALMPTVRGLRTLPLLRLLRLVRTFAGLYRALAGLDRLANHRGLARLIVVWLAVMVVCSIGFYLAENGVSKWVTSPLDALWWGVVTLSAVGYGDVYPITPEGRLFGGALMILGIGVFGAIKATMASYLVATQQEAAGHSTTFASWSTCAMPACSRLRSSRPSRSIRCGASDAPPWKWTPRRPCPPSPDRVPTTTREHEASRARNIGLLAQLVGAHA